MKIFALDDRPYDRCGFETVQAARARGHRAALFVNAHQLRGVDDAYIFARPHQWQPRLRRDVNELEILRRQPLNFIQDELQVACYENKLMQARVFKDWMPETWIEGDPEEAFRRAHSVNYPIVSKASEGSASHNVRILRNVNEAVAEIEQAFGAGIPIVAGAGNAAVQKGYVLWQAVIPHGVTFRVTRVGDHFHSYLRYNYDDRPVAAPSKVKQTKPDSREAFERAGPCSESLYEFAKRFTDAAGTKWVALDILWDEMFLQWRVIETSLAWARGNDPAGNAKFFGTNYSLNTQHELLIEEIEKGVFG